MCFNRKVIGALVATGLGVWLLAPNLLAGVVPLLVVAACPLSMILMMRTMSGGRGQGQTKDTPDGTRAAGGDDAEIARLQAEVDRLRGERAAGTAAP